MAALVAALHDSDDDVRVYAAESLGRLGQASPEAVAALVAALHDSDAMSASMQQRAWGNWARRLPKPWQRWLLPCTIAPMSARNAAQSLGRLGQASPEVINELCEAVQEAGERAIRRDAAHLLGRVGQGDNVVIDALWRGLLDEDDEIRRTCTQALAQIGRRNTAIAELIEKRFVEAIHDPKFEQGDRDF